MVRRWREGISVASSPPIVRKVTMFVNFSVSNIGKALMCWSKKDIYLTFFKPVNEQNKRSSRQNLWVNITEDAQDNVIDQEKSVHYNSHKSTALERKGHMETAENPIITSSSRSEWCMRLSNIHASSANMESSGWPVDYQPTHFFLSYDLNFFLSSIHKNLCCCIIPIPEIHTSPLRLT